LGAAGLYLVYVGAKDVPFFEGLAELLRGKPPTAPKKAGYVPKTHDFGASGSKLSGSITGAAGDKGIDRLVGNAAAAYPAMRAIAPGVIYGWGLRPSGTSDHPRGLAMDIMTTDNSVASEVIQLFLTQTGAKYWIWNRRIASAERGWIPRPYSGISPHTDHVHLSYY